MNEFDRWKQEKFMEDAKVRFEQHHQGQLAARAAAESSAISGIRALMLVNGGAVVTLLAFIGTVVASDKGADVDLDVVTRPLRFFALGVGFSILASLSAYLTNWFAAGSYAKMDQSWIFPYLRSTDGSERDLKWMSWCQASGFVFVGAGILLFFAGVFAIASAVSKLGI